MTQMSNFKVSTRARNISQVVDLKHIPEYLNALGHTPKKKKKKHQSIKTKG